MKEKIISGLLIVGVLVFMVFALKGIAGAPVSVWMFR